jgi:signal transduction histidine kinase/ligand-binding sensor domain-containing protein
MDVFEDKNGGLWFGTYGGGINYFNPRLNRFNFMSHNFIDKGSINPNTVLSILEDRSGALFVGTDGGGLNVRFPGSNDFEHFLKNPGSVGSNSITSLTEDKNGNVWIGTDPGINNKSGAVLLFNRNKKSFITLNNIDIVFGGISSLYVDSKNNLWIALATDGLRKYNIESKTTETFRVDKNNPQSIPTNSIFSIIEDDDGFIWLGTPGSGLLRLDVDKKIFKTYLSDPKNQNSISSNAVWTVAKDNNGDLWFGTWGGGLNKYNKNDNTFQRFTEKEGLSGNVIYGIIPDSKGFIWLSTNKGISRIDLSELKINNFDLSNGLPSIEFSLNAFCMDKEKKLYFGGTEGITFFDPERITGNSFIPPVLITKIYVQGEELKLLKPAYMIHEIELDYDQNFFSFEFSALDYSASKKNVYKYRLEGVDKDWLFTSGRRFANYTDISPGRYVFRLKSSNNDGVWSNNDVTLSIIIHPPFWATWWFRAAGVALLILLLYSVHKYRLNRLLEVERTRIKIARDLHDEVSASITGIVYFADAIKSELNEKESPEVNKLVNLIGESANQIQESMSDIIWSINPENDDWNIVLPKFRRFASDLCESKNIVYNIDISENAFARPLKMEQRHELWLIFKEIVTNAVKHSECSFMSINLFGDMENIHLIVEDNGKGFDSSVPSPNNGIKNIKSRTKSLEGTAELITEREKGTKWIVKIPLTKNR